MDDYLKGSNMLYVEALCPQLTASPQHPTTSSSPIQTCSSVSAGSRVTSLTAMRRWPPRIGGLDPLAGGRPRIHQLYLAGLKVGSSSVETRFAMRAPSATLTTPVEPSFGYLTVTYAKRWRRRFSEV